MSNPYATTQSSNVQSARLAIYRPIWWLATLPILGIQIAVISASAYWFGFPHGVLYGVGAYLLYSFGSRWLLLRAHRRGIRLNSVGRYEDAIAAFEESYQFFSRHPWLDRYRAITMLTPAAMNYREMALCNIGVAYSRLGMGQKATEAYRRALAEFPHSVLAAASLRMIEAGEGIASPQPAAI